MHIRKQQMWAHSLWSDIVLVLISIWHEGQVIFTACGPRVYVTCWWITRTSGWGTEFGSALKCGCDCADWLDDGYTGVGITVWFGIADWSEIAYYIWLFFLFSVLKET